MARTGSEMASPEPLTNCAQSDKMTNFVIVFGLSNEHLFSAMQSGPGAAGLVPG